MTKKFYRRPNNSGTVVKLSGKRRRPYMAKVTSGTDPLTGAQIQTPVGYFETRQDALDALAVYSMTKQHVTLPDDNATVRQVLEYQQRDLPTFGDIAKVIIGGMDFSQSRIRCITAADKRLAPLHDRKISRITLFDLQDCFDASKKEVGQKTLTDMKTLCSKVFEYAVIHQYIRRDDDYTGYIDIRQKDAPAVSAKHKAFTMAEIRVIVSSSCPDARTVLCYILTGCRPGELWNVPDDRIHLDEYSDDDGTGRIISYIVTGSKTQAGRNRVIPVHTAIKPYIADVLVSLRETGRDAFKKRFNGVMASCGLSGHTPYDCRHTFATLARLYDMDEFCRKRIMGHKAQDITDDVYTRSINNRLYDEMQKIKI